MQVAGEHDVDVLRRKAGLGHRHLERTGAIDAVDIVELRALLAAEPGVDQHGARAADDQRPHRERDAIARVGRRSLLPHHFRHGAEHRAAVESDQAIAQRDELEIAHGEPPDRQIRSNTNG